MFSVCGCVRLNERLIECLMYVCVHLRESEREREREREKEVRYRFTVYVYTLQ